MPCRVKHSGVALITVLMVVALASIIVFDMMADQNLDIRRTSNRQALSAAAWCAESAEALAIIGLVEDAKNSKTDDLLEDWAVPVGPVPIEECQISGQLEDLHARFNLNNLLTEDGKVSALDAERFRRLLKILEVEPTLALAIQDWIDADIDPMLPSGAEDDYYAGLEHPYRAANRKFVSISELRLVRDLDAESFDKLKDFVIALPERTGINVNTAPKEVLQALAEHIDASTADSLIEERQESPFDSVKAFTENGIHGKDKDRKVEPEGIVVNSDYFRSKSLAVVGKMKLDQFTWFKRSGQKVKIVQRARRAE